MRSSGCFLDVVDAHLELSVTATENWTMTSYNYLSVLSNHDKSPPCRSLLFPTNITVWRESFLRVWAIATDSTDNCRWPDLNVVGNCSSPELELLIVGSNDNITVCAFYRASYASTILAVSVCVYVCLSVRLSVTSRSSTKAVKPRITLTTPYDSSGTLVLVGYQGIQE